MSSKPLGGYSVSAHSLVEHVRRRVKQREQLRALLRRAVPSEARYHYAKGRLQDVERDLAEIRQLVQERER